MCIARKLVATREIGTPDLDNAALSIELRRSWGEDRWSSFFQLWRVIYATSEQPPSHRVDLFFSG